MLLGSWRRRPPPLVGASPERVECERVSGHESLELPNGTLRASPPHRFRTLGDGAVAWQYQGTPSGNEDEPQGPYVRLSGDALLVTSGPLPQFPLYFYRPPDDSFLTVCSELAPLARMANAHEIDIRRLVSIIAWQHDPEPAATPFVELRKVRACEWIRADHTGIVVTTRVPTAGNHYLRTNPSQLAAELREELARSVDRAIGNCRRIAVYVSGGLDSSGLLALALRHHDKRADIGAVAQAWAAPGDDGPHLATLERALGIVAVKVHAREAAPWFASSLCMDAQPQTDAAACLDAHLWTTGASRGAEVGLGGYGGDELCGGPISFAPLVRRGHPVAAVAMALRLRTPWTRTPLQRIAHWVMGPVVRPYLPRSLVVAVLQRRHRTPWMTPKFLELLEPYLRSVPTGLPESPDDWLRHFCMHPYFGELSRSWGQIGSIARTAVVDVFRDLEFVRLVAQIDPVIRSYGNEFRGLYRLAMKEVVPDSIRMRSDKALGYPAIAAAAVAADAEATLRALSSLEHVASLGLVDPEAFRQPFSRWVRTLMRGERTNDDPIDAIWHTIWMPLAVEAFLRQYADRPRTSRTPCPVVL